MAFAGTDGTVRRYTAELEAVRTPLVLRCWSGDACSRALRIDVRALPRIVDGSFVVQPPSYTGSGAIHAPGPPAPLEAVGGGRARVTVTLDRRAEALIWHCGAEAAPLHGQARGRTWTAELEIGTGAPSGAYTLAAVLDGRERVVAEGLRTVRPDTPPEALSG